jgi:hypothetical protein
MLGSSFDYSRFRDDWDLGDEYREFFRRFSQFVGVADDCDPVADGEVLCRGAALPYYEFAHTGRLTDEEWIKLLNSKDRPDVPAWIKPIFGKDSIKALKPASGR